MHLTCKSDMDDLPMTSISQKNLPIRWLKVQADQSHAFPPSCAACVYCQPIVHNRFLYRSLDGETLATCIVGWINACTDTLG
jgi:hypothetical protein